MIGGNWEPGDFIEAREDVNIESVKLSDVKGFHIEVKMRVPYNEETLRVLGQIYQDRGSCRVSLSHEIPQPDRTPDEIARDQTGELGFDEEDDEGMSEPES